MVRNYKRKKDIVSADAMKMAISAVKKLKMSIRQAATQYKVCRSSLHRFCKAVTDDDPRIENIIFSRPGRKKAVISEEVTNSSPSSQKVDRKVCRLCAKLKPVETLAPFYGSEYEQFINKLVPFGLCIKKEDGYLPSDICLTCSRKILSCKNIIETFIEVDNKFKEKFKTTRPPMSEPPTRMVIINFKELTEPHEVQNNDTEFAAVKQETPETVDVAKTEVALKNQMPIMSENSFHTEIEIKDEMAEIYKTDIDSLNNTLNEGYKEVIELNKNENVIVKDELNQIQMTESQGISENAFINELDVKEEVVESDDLQTQESIEIEQSQSVTDPVDRNRQSGIPWVELFECCDCKKRYSTKETVISHITTVHAKDQITYHAKFEAVRINIRNHLNVSNADIPAEDVNRRQIYHHIVRPPVNEAVKKGILEHLIQHRRVLNDQARSTRIYRCNVCKRTMSSLHLMKCHKDLHNGVKKPFTCEKCDSTYSEYSKWYIHQREHIERSFECKICDKAFRSMQTMKSHVTRVHMREKNYQCSTCKKQFQYMSALTYHMKNLECKKLSSH